MKRFLALAVFVAIAISGCTTKTSELRPKDGVLRADQVTFPDPDKAWIDARYMFKETADRVEKGMSKDQVRELIGHPMFREGMYAVTEWDYLFNLKERAGVADEICQFKVIFDENATVGSTFWQPECGSKKSAEKAESFELESDFLFDFGKASLKPAGVAKIKEIATKFKSINKVEVLGYTDPIGSEASNLALSKRRANSVKAELVKQGVSSKAIRAKGMGESEQVKVCDMGLKRAKLVECLAPNRRVVIAVDGEK